jgi:hypothetical protein
MTTPSMKRMEQTSPDGSVRCCDNGDMDEKHECLKQLPTADSEGEKQFEEKMSKYFFDALTLASKFGAEMKGTKFEGMYPDQSIKIRDKAIEYTKSLITSVRREEREYLVEKVGNLIEDYFVNLIAIPNPPATKNSLKQYIITAIKGEWKKKV